jgi:hypothetical protein
MKARPHSVSLKTLVLLACLFAHTRQGLATTAILPGDDDLIIGARAIVRAKVISVDSGLGDDDRIYTYVGLRVRETLKGHVAGRKIVLKELGGQVGDRGSIIYGNAQFVPGEEVFLYLDTWADGSLRVYQMFLGKFNVVTDPATGESVVVRPRPDANTVVLRREAGERGGPATERMKLSDYRRMVEASLAANRERSRVFEQTYYAGTPVLAEPQEYERAALGGALHPQYTLIASPPPRWFEPDDNLPVVFMVNPDNAPNPQVMDDVNAAMNVWSNIPGCSLRVANGGTMDSCYLGTGVNAIVFNNCDGRNAPSPFCAGVLAWGGLNWFGSITRVVNGTTFVKAREGFVSFNPYAACNFGEHCQVQEIAAHEIGHALGLGHSQNSDATMAAFAHFDGRCASLRQDDINGVLFIYPASGAGPGPISIATGSPLAPASPGVAYSQRLVASGGREPYRWAVSAGVLPQGLTLGEGGTISGTPSATGTFNFTVRVTDSNSATAQKDLALSVFTTTSEYDGVFVSQNVPASVQPGQSFTVSIKWLNTGTREWSGSGGFRLGSQNPPNNVTWGGNAVNLPGFVTPARQHLDLTFTAFAPETPGTYNFQWQMYQEGVGFFGQLSANAAIQVGTGGGENPTNAAAFVTQSVPASMTAGHSYLVAVTMRNTGTTTWSAGSYKLASQNPENNSSWGSSRVALPSAIPPGAQATFTFAVTAPAAPGAYNFQWQMYEEGAGFFGQMSDNASVNVIQLTSPVINEPPALGAMKGAPFKHQFTALGGEPPYTWAVAGGALPAGVSLNTNLGVVAGVAAETGNFSFTLRVVDSQSRAGQKAVTIAVAPALLRITTTSLPNVMRGAAFGHKLAATGGTEPYSWSLGGGALPAGLGIDTSTGMISGTPAASGTFIFAVDVVDAASRAATKSLALTVLAPPLAVDGGSSIEGTKGVALSYHLSVVGGLPPYTWAVMGGALPAGLALNSATGAISGTPVVGGAFTVTVGVRDQNGESASKVLQIRLLDPERVPVITAAKYKASKRKLTVSGERFDPAATLLIDGAQAGARLSGGRFLVKRLSLGSGRHEIRVVNPGGVFSQAFSLDVK